MNLKALIAAAKRKYGPLPLWAWATLVGGAIALYWRMRAPAPEPDAFAAPLLAYGQLEPDYGDSGSAGLGGVPAVDPAPVEAPYDLYPDNKLREASMELIDQIRGITEELDTVTPGTEPGGETVVDPGTDRVIEEFAGVRWGGQIFSTKRGLAAYLRGRGQSWKAWAKNHPTAARSLLGPPPKPPKPRKPKKAKKPSKRDGAREPAKRGAGRAGARTRKPPRPAPTKARPRMPAPKARAKPQPQPKPKPKPKRRRIVIRGGRKVGGR